MSYQKLNLDNGTTLSATHLQHIENGIESAHNRQPLIFNGSVIATYDGTKEVTVNIPSGGEAGGNSTFDIVIDFTTTEDVTEFQIPINTNELVNKIKGATSIYMALDIPRDEADTETSTVGDVDIHLFASWDQVLFSNLPAIPPPSVTWAKNGKATMKYENIIWGSSDGLKKLPTLKWYAAYIDNYTSAKEDGITFANVNSFSYLSTSSYLTITGSQNMCAGTRFILGVL